MQLNRPTPELPVRDVEKAQIYYRDKLGCKIGWIVSDKSLGAVSSGNTAIFLRKREDPFEPAVHWIFEEHVDQVFQELTLLGARILEGIEDKPWHHRQFTVADLDGNIFYFHCDL